MLKLQKLIDHLTAAPLGISADAISVWTETGNVHSLPVTNNGQYALSYQANIYLPAYAAYPLPLFLLLCDWLAKNETSHPEDALSWESDILDKHRVDLVISVKLTENIRLEQTPDGVHIRSVDDPDMNPVPLPSGAWETFTSANGGLDQKLQDWLHEGGEA